MTTVTYYVPNISCQHCIHTIKNELGELSGVHHVDAVLETKKVTIAFDEPATEEKIVSLMAEINYPPAK